MDLGTVTHGTFEERMGEAFAIPVEGGEPLRLELVEVTLRGQAPAEGGGRQAFSLVFAGPMEPLLPQQVLPLENDHLGSMDLFLVPIGPAEDRMQYEAIFN